LRDKIKLLSYGRLTGVACICIELKPSFVIYLVVF